MEQGEGLIPVEPPKPPERDRSIEKELDTTFGAFRDVLKDLQQRNPGLFNPPTRDAYEANRASLPWPLDQKNAGLFFGFEEGAENDGLEITWEDENGEYNKIDLGHTKVRVKSDKLLHEEAPKYIVERQAFYERMQGERVLSYSNGYMSDFTLGTPPDEIPMKTASSGQWVISNDNLRLERILEGLKQYSASLPPTQ